VLYPLVNRQNRQIAGSRQTASIVERLHVTEYGRRTVVIDHHAVDIVVSWQVELVGWNGHTTMLQQAVGIFAKQL